MTRRGGAVHVATTRRHYKDKVYETHLLRRSYREGGRVKTETLGNLSHLPAATIELIRRSLKGEVFVPAGHAPLGPDGFTIARSLPHGHVAAAAAMAAKLGLVALIGPPCQQRDLVVGLVLARVCKPGSKLAATRWWADTTVGVDLGLLDASTDQVYAAMDWLLSRKQPIQAALAARHLAGGGRVLFDLSSSWLEGWACPLAKPGHSRDGKRGKPQIEYGIIADPQGRPVGVEVLAGNTGDPTSFTAAVATVRERFGLHEVTFVGDRGTISWSRRTEQIQAEAAIDGIYVIRTPLPTQAMAATEVVGVYKSLAEVEADFRSWKATDLQLRPIYHWTENRVRAHLLLCLLAGYLTWHLRRALGPITFTDTDRPGPARPDPVAPAPPSTQAKAKAASKATPDHEPVCSYQTLLEHLATLTRNTCHIAGTPTQASFDKLAEPTPTQRRAFELIGTTIPLRLT